LIGLDQDWLDLAPGSAQSRKQKSEDRTRRTAEIGKAEERKTLLGPASPDSTLAFPFSLCNSKLLCGKGQGGNADLSRLLQLNLSVRLLEMSLFYGPSAGASQFANRPGSAGASPYQTAG
jgi:hypothetical protein